MKILSCDFSVLSGPGVLYHMRCSYNMYEHETGRSEQLFPDSAESSTPAFGASGRLRSRCRRARRAPSDVALSLRCIGCARLSSEMDDGREKHPICDKCLELKLQTTYMCGMDCPANPGA